MYLSPPPMPRNEKLEIWQKNFMADLALPKFDVPPCPKSQKDVDGTRMEHEHEWARDGKCICDGTI